MNPAVKKALDNTRKRWLILHCEEGAEKLRTFLDGEFAGWMHGDGYSVRYFTLPDVYHPHYMAYAKMRCALMMLATLFAATLPRAEEKAA